MGIEQKLYLAELDEVIHAKRDTITGHVTPNGDVELKFGQKGKHKYEISGAVWSEYMEQKDGRPLPEALANIGRELERRSEERAQKEAIRAVVEMSGMPVPLANLVADEVTKETARGAKVSESEIGALRPPTRAIPKSADKQNGIE